MENSQISQTTIAKIADQIDSLETIRSASNNEISQIISKRSKIAQRNVELNKIENALEALETQVHEF